MKAEPRSATRDDGESSEVPTEKTVRFNPITKCHVFSDGLTPEEVDQLWWNREEIAEIKLSCRCIAKKSRLLRSVTEVIISELYQETQDLTQSSIDGVELETCLMLSRSARRFVRNYSTVGSQRGLERWISDELKARNKRSENNKARICRLQRVAGMTDEVIAQITQTFSRFDRIIARLLGQADELANTRRTIDPRRREVSPIESGVLPLSPRRSLQIPSHDRHTSRDPKLGKDACSNVVPLIRHMAPPFMLSAGSHCTFQ